MNGQCSCPLKVQRWEVKLERACEILGRIKKRSLANGFLIVPVGYRLWCQVKRPPIFYSNYNIFVCRAFILSLSGTTGRSIKGCGIFPDCLALTVTASRSYCNIDVFFVFLSRSLFNETILGHLLILSSTNLWKGCWPHSVCHLGGGEWGCDYCQFQESEPVISTLGIMKIK